MSKRKSTTSSSAAAADTYDSDNGFVEEDAPRNKKPKANKSGLKAEKGRREAGNRKAGASKEGGEIAGGGMVGKNGDGVFWELTKLRRVGINEFKGEVMIDVREYYEKDGETLPGKKGISLPVEQLNTLIKLLPHIETVLAEKGQSLERPDYSGDADLPRRGVPSNWS